MLFLKVSQQRKTKCKPTAQNNHIFHLCSQAPIYFSQMLFVLTEAPSGFLHPQDDRNVQFLNAALSHHSLWTPMLMGWGLKVSSKLMLQLHQGGEPLRTVKSGEQRASSPQGMNAKCGISYHRYGWATNSHVFQSCLACSHSPLFFLTGFLTMSYFPAMSWYNSQALPSCLHSATGLPSFQNPEPNPLLLFLICQIYGLLLQQQKID